MLNQGGGKSTWLTLSEDSSRVADWDCYLWLRYQRAASANRRVLFLRYDLRHLCTHICGPVAMGLPP